MSVHRKYVPSSKKVSFKLGLCSIDWQVFQLLKSIWFARQLTEIQIPIFKPLNMSNLIYNLIPTSFM